MSDWKRIAEDLREQAAALTQKLENMTGANMLNANALRLNKEKLAAAQATNEQLREALENIRSASEPGDWPDEFNTLAIPDNTAALDARLAQEREKCAGICDRFHERMMVPAECAAAIRSMT